MSQIVEFPIDHYRSRVFQTARWLKGREPHLIEKNWRSEVNRFVGHVTCRGGVSPEEAAERGALFGRHLLDRLDAIDEAARTSPRCRVIALADIEASFRKIYGVDPREVIAGRVSMDTLRKAVSKP